jgi:hypothetical protein
LIEMSNADKVILESLVARVEQLTEKVAASEKAHQTTRGVLSQAQRILNNNMDRLAEHYRDEARQVIAYREKR